MRFYSHSHIFTSISRRSTIHPLKRPIILSATLTPSGWHFLRLLRSSNVGYPREVVHVANSFPTCAAFDSCPGFRKPTYDSLDAARAGGMCGKKLWGSSMSLFIFYHSMPHLDSSLRIVAAFGHHHQPNTISLRFLCSAVWQRKEEVNDKIRRGPRYIKEISSHSRDYEDRYTT